MNITTLGIDIGKSTFHLVGLDEHDQPTLKKKLRNLCITPEVQC